MSAKHTFAPSLAKRTEAARPIPEPEPVINATLFLNLNRPPYSITF